VHQNLALLGAIAPSHLLSTFGVIGVLVVIFVQTGLLVGFFLPGDSLLFLAGYATDRHNSLGFHLSLGWLLVAAAGGALVGGQLGFEVGRRAGATLAERPDSRWFSRASVERANRFLARFGATRAVVLSRFVPVVRTFTSPIVGVAGVPTAAYTTANLIGAFAWTVPIVLLGHWLGHISFIRKYVEVIAVLAVVLSIVPALVHMARHRSG
jgi:membrane-associated protein